MASQGKAKEMALKNSNNVHARMINKIMPCIHFHMIARITADKKPNYVQDTPVLYSLRRCEMNSKNLFITQT